MGRQGVRSEWRHVPPAVRHRVDLLLGSAVVGTTAVQGAGPGGIQARHPGIALLYDAGLMAARVGTGLVPTYREGAMVRVRNEANEERPWPGGGRRSSTPIKERSSPVSGSQGCSRRRALRSAWMAAAERSTTCSSSGYGEL